MCGENLSLSFRHHSHYDNLLISDGKTHCVEADVGTLRQIATRLKVALQDGSGFHMRRCGNTNRHFIVIAGDFEFSSVHLLICAGCRDLSSDCN